ncbi:MAG: bifunctional adenosylcobinamide kinase/adenosylcobinamide-phosphate guanylyltransferase [Pseudomonadota bacterium]
MTGALSLILGGARSGKSRYGETLVQKGASQAVDTKPTLIATAQAWDQEMADRIARHKADRGVGWHSIEEPLDLLSALKSADQPGAHVLVDCLTLWLTNLMCVPPDSLIDIDSKIAELAAWRPQAAAHVVFVSNEIGLGIVPDNAMARAFRDHAGRLHQSLAASADHVVLMVAGLPMAVKGALPHEAINVGQTG